MITPTDALALADLQRRYQAAIADADELRLDYYRTLVAIADRGATYREIAQVLGVHLSRVGQLMEQARRTL